MIASISGIIAILMYATATFYQHQRLMGAEGRRERVLWLGLGAALLHLLNVVGLIWNPGGYDFGLFRIATLFSWVIVAIVLLSSLRRPVDNLFIGLFPLAILSIASSLLASSSPLHSGYTPGMAFHIVLAILATSLVTMAAFQALLIYLQNHQLKHHSVHLIRGMPPLQTMEALLFEMVWAGFLLLTAVLVTGVLFMDDFLGQHLTHKTVLSLLAWLVFAILLWGRHQLGWRGSKAIRWTLTGFSFLVLAYFGSKFVLEILLERV